MNDETNGSGTTATPSSNSDVEVLPKLRHELERLHGPDEVKQRILASITMRAHSGPLPAAEDFAHYGATEPTAPKTILDMAVRQQRHDHWMDKATLVSETIYRLVGIGSAAAVVFAAIYIGYQLVLAGHPEIGAGLGPVVA